MGRRPGSGQTRLQLLRTVLALALGTLMVPGLAMAQPHALALSAGEFVPVGQGSRVAGDVLVADLSASNGNALRFTLRDFTNRSYNIEWLLSFGQHVEAGFGAGWYASDVPSTYRDFINADGSEIAQRLRLRIVPVTATLRVLPLSSRAAVQPYVGVGVGLLVWRYSETGDFVDLPMRIFNADYSQQGTAVSPVFLGGVRVPLGRRIAFGGEARYQMARARLSADFLGNRLDLGGLTYHVTLLFRL